jgi:hypothetical protein
MAITRGVLSKAETTKVIVNVQEVTNDETPPAITGGDVTFPAGTCLEGDNYSVVAKTTAQASDRLGFSWSRVSGPAQLTIDAATGEVKTTTAFSRTSNWNNTTSGGNPAAEATFRATDTAGNSSDVTLTFPITYTGNLASWATGASQDYEISYRISQSSSGHLQTSGTTPLNPVYPNIELSGHFDQLEGVTSAAPAGSLSHLFPWNTMKIGTGNSGAKHHFVTSTAGQLVARQNFNNTAPDWTSSSTHSLAAAVTSRNHYYYEIQTIPGLAGYSGQFVDDNGQNEEFFRDPDDITNSRVRVVHSSKASTVPISTGQPINMGSAHSSPSSTVVFPGDFLCYEQGTYKYVQKYIGETYYAINNGDGTISFATTKAQAHTGTPDVLFTSAWTSDLQSNYGLIRIRPAVIKENPDTYTISPDYTIGVTTYKNTGSFDFFGSGTEQVYYYDNGQNQTVLSVNATGGPSIGTRTFTTVYGLNVGGTTQTGTTANAGSPATFNIVVTPSWGGSSSAFTVLVLRDERMGYHSKTIDIDRLDQMVDTSGTTISQNMASWTGGTIYTSNITGGFTGTKTFTILNASANLVSANITKGTETTTSCQINVDAGFAGTGTFDLVVNDLIGNSETISYTINVAQAAASVQTITHGSSSPVTGVDYYGYYSQTPTAGSISPSTVPGFFAGGQVTDQVQYQSAFGNINFYFAVRNQGTAIPQNHFTSITVDDGVNTRVFTSSSASYLGNGGPTGAKWTRWGWTISSSDAQYQRISSLNPNGSATWTITLA